jgi:hypothetical protein
LVTQKNTSPIMFIYQWQKFGDANFLHHRCVLSRASDKGFWHCEFSLSPTFNSCWSSKGQEPINAVQLANNVASFHFRRWDPELGIVLG